jgi:hypothetical protein
LVAVKTCTQKCISRLAKPDVCSIKVELNTCSKKCGCLAQPHSSFTVHYQLTIRTFI